MNMTESGSGSGKPAHTAARPVQVCVGLALLLEWLPWGGMLPCLKTKHRGAVRRALCATFVVGLQAAQKGSAFQRARASLNVFAPSWNKTLPLPPAVGSGPEVGLGRSAVTRFSSLTED